MRTIKVRQASREDLYWINERYKEVEFVPSNENDYLAIAKVENKFAGVGRIVPVEKDRGELGGMYVFEEYRGSGASRAIIQHLLDNARHEVLYCLPFENLEGLYASFGFDRIKEQEMGDVPDKVLEKHRWCNEFYSKPVLLMQMMLHGRAM